MEWPTKTFFQFRGASAGRKQARVAPGNRTQHGLTQRPARQTQRDDGQSFQLFFSERAKARTWPRHFALHLQGR